MGTLLVGLTLFAETFFPPVLAMNLFVIPRRVGFASCSDTFVTFSMCQHVPFTEECREPRSHGGALSAPVSK